MLTGRYHPREGGEDKQLRAAVHLAADETVDGIVLYKQDGRDDQGDRKIKISVLVSESPEGYLALWQFLGGIDLVGRLTFHGLAPEDPIRWALRDINALQVKAVNEFLWVRVIDLPRAFAGPAVECRRRGRDRGRRPAGLRRRPLAGAHARRGGRGRDRPTARPT